MIQQPREVIGPKSKKQELFLNSDATITLAGGAAGSGKTFTSLLIALRFMMIPKSTGVIFRKNSKMLTAPGSIWHEAVGLFSGLVPNLKIRHRDTEMVFPNGSILKFSHMQYTANMYDHKGAQYSLVIFDEATDFDEEAIIYLLSRMRNANVSYQPQMFLMTNPDYESFLRLWIQDFYLDQTGIPIPEKSGIKRWFFREGNSMVWYNSKEEAEAIHGKGSDNGLGSFTFIGANIYDNPVLMKNNPSYLSRLLNLPPVEKARLLYGSWFARPEAAGYFKREWAQEVNFPNALARQRVRAWDFAFTPPSDQYPNPDWTRGTLISKDKNSVYTVEDLVSIRDRVHAVEDLIFKTAIKDGQGVTISIPLDPAAAAGAYARDLQKRLAEMGFHCKLSKPVKSKLVRFVPFSSVAQAGFVQVVKADWNKDFYDELESFDGLDNSKKKDDIVDTCSDAFLHLNRELQLPTFSLPDMGKAASFGYQPNNVEKNIEVLSVIIK